MSKEQLLFVRCRDQIQFTTLTCFGSDLREVSVRTLSEAMLLDDVYVLTSVLSGAQK